MLDELGAGKLLSPATVLKALGLAKKGKIYNLGRVLAPDMLQLDDNPSIAPGHRYRITPRPRRELKSGPLGESLDLPTHTGTHIDALGHWYCEEKHFGGLGVDDNWTENGLAHLGIEHCPPIVTRGVLLDVARSKRVEFLEPDSPITPADLQDSLQGTGLKLQPGDVALVRTGWVRLAMRRDARYIQVEPGLGAEAASWLADQGVVLIGADNWAVEFISESDPLSRVVHELCLAKRGIYLVENLNLEGLADDRACECLFILSPPRVKGSTAAPVEPIAIV